jgi:hypothetical protein
MNESITYAHDIDTKVKFRLGRGHASGTIIEQVPSSKGEPAYRVRLDSTGSVRTVSEAKVTAVDDDYVYVRKADRQDAISA